MSGKRLVDLKKEHDLDKAHSLDDALKGVLAGAKTRKIEESVDLTIMLSGLKQNQPDHQIRTFSQLPVGLKKPVKILVFADGDQKAEATKAKADWVGLDELVTSIQKGSFSLNDVDVVLAAPSSMRALGKVGKLLGPKGLMPNAKDGTVTDKLAEKIAALKEGSEVRFKADKTGIIHCPVGRSHFSSDDLAKNIKHVLDHVARIKPASVKGRFLKKVCISSTMGLGFELDVASLAS
jgi:large subunit ribosomal protein L1